MPDSLLLLIPGLPFLAAIWIVIGFMFGWNRGEKGERETAFVAVTANTLSLLAMLALAIYDFTHGAPGHVMLFPWLQSGDYQAYISLTLDTLSLSFGVVMATITLLVTRFSVNYLHRETGFQRFFIVISLFSSAMLLIVLSGSALLGFIGWEMAGISSYMLIAYAWQRETAVEGATRAFVTNRFGDTGYLFGMFVAFSWFGSTEWHVLLQRHEHVSSMVVGIMTMGFMLAAMVKSAQFPFTAWITRALEGPTPSSAVFYGSIMVHAGIYLLLRLEPLLEQLPLLGYGLMLVGTLTVLYGWLGAQVQTDIKSSLIFSTQQQTGLMLVEISLGWYTFAAFHMGLHAVWRAYQFLHSPSFLQQTGWEPARAAPLWLRKHPWLYTAALQRLWLVPLENWLLVRPTQALAHEVQTLDSLFIDRLTGTPSHSNMLSNLADMQAFQQGKLRLESSIGKGSGVLGKLMQWVAEHFEWLEDRLLLKKGGGKLADDMQQVGTYLDLIEELLSQPRYLILVIAVTLAVIL
jgi:NADH:ubiquinone oxidoreductase subunit 5 (subunit L)/multisubunit Na+/H+ antiporter MnhA subunit